MKKHLHRPRRQPWMIDNWQSEIWRLWSCRAALFWCGVSALAGGWTQLGGDIPHWLFVTGGIVLPVSLMAARLLKQAPPDA